MNNILKRILKKRSCLAQKNQDIESSAQDVVHNIAIDFSCKISLGEMYLFFLKAITAIFFACVTFSVLFTLGLGIISIICQYFHCGMILD